MGTTTGKRMRGLLVLALFCLFTYCLASDSNTVELYKRCEYCNAGYCYSQKFQVNSCEPYTDPCTGIRSGTYFIDKQGDNDYYIKTFQNNNCSSELDLSVHVYCDTCYYYEQTTLCPAFFIRCTSYWWLWTLCIIFVAIAGCLLVAGIAAYFRKRQQKALYASGAQPEYVSYEQAVHQSQATQSYQAPPSINY